MDKTCTRKRDMLEVECFKEDVEFFRRHSFTDASIKKLVPFLRCHLIKEVGIPRHAVTGQSARSVPFE